MPLAQPNITLGTAGHIDHGKTSLVKFLTGCETDRLKEEKERGMSIDLGFAPCTIGDLEVGIVDVPGHENFVKTMVAASGMDGVILVAAADDGVMPQTREHLDILTLPGHPPWHGGVDEDRPCGRRVPRTGPVRTRGVPPRDVSPGRQDLPVSNLTGQGYEPFYDALVDLIRSIRPKRTDGVFRMPVDCAFSAAGYGTVVAGIPVAGSAHAGDEVLLLPQGIVGRIRQIQVYGRSSDTVMAGQCARSTSPLGTKLHRPR